MAARPSGGGAEEKSSSYKRDEECEKRIGRQRGEDGGEGEENGAS